ncbi:hypothetical protein [Fulvimonas soli]|jgi:hypothetical protein|nr:hypothetical protein [Fulvimonas soli]
MKRFLAMLPGALLAACGAHGLRDTTPKLSSHTGKDVAAYVECVRGKWDALGVQASASAKDQEGRVSASDKNGARELIQATADGTGALVVLYERQDRDKTYDPRYRDAAVGCL